MNRARRFLIPLSTALVAAGIAAGPAAASHGGGGSTPPPPPPAVTTDPCEGYWDTTYTDGSVAVVNASNGGCVIVRSAPAGYLVLDRAIPLPGWTYTVDSNGGGTNSRVQVTFTNPATGQRAQVRVEYGKTVIS
jgi:hypothetical protein